MDTKIEAINWTNTGGSFGRRRVLSTFTIYTRADGRLNVNDDRDGGRLCGAGFASVEDVLKVYRQADDWRTRPR